MRGIMIAGTHSGCGKTIVTLGMLAALRKKGLKVQAFKAGPDFIDGGLHRMITGRPSRNLDLWMCGEAYVKDCYYRNSSDADIAVVEGVMGLYDGEPSTASLASELGIPVILVIDSYGMAETAGAIVKGMSEWGSGSGPKINVRATASVDIGGVIFNRVASENHYRRLCAGLGDVRALGYLPRDLSFEIPHRHLGLTVAEEEPITEESVDRLADAVLRFIDLEKALPSAIPGRRPSIHCHQAQIPDPAPFVTIAVAYDRAFCFYYEDNLDILRNAGAKIIHFSPLADRTIPEGVDAVYIGGGYPELYASELSRNVSMLNSVRDWALSGRPLYAECGGLMYLSRGIRDFREDFFPMAGVFAFATRMKKGRSKLGYRRVFPKRDSVIGKKGEEIRGHEFHYSEVEERPEDAISQIYAVRNGSGEELNEEGYSYKRTLASYIHIHFGSNPGIANEFIGNAKGKGN